MPSVSQIRTRLLAWYDENRRSLPWRAPPGGVADPYRVWLSEVMLQQTTVAHATRYFLEFTERWPSLEDLAAADDGQVMAAWAGLGYYARARNLLACARAVSSEYGGRFPRDPSVLRALPGIGAYTSAAMAAIAFDTPANVVDGNIERVMARLYAVQTPLPAAKPELTRLAAELATVERPGDWAQALMDLGATICRPRMPACDSCPIREGCRARSSGAAESYPRKTPKAHRPRRHGVAFILRNHGHLALVRRPPRGLLGGMLGLPTTPWRLAAWSLAEAVALAPAPGPWREVGSTDHVFTHFSLDLRVMSLAIAERPSGWIWHAPALALADTPSVFSKAILVAQSEDG